MDSSSQGCDENKSLKQIFPDSDATPLFKLVCDHVIESLHTNLLEKPSDRDSYCMYFTPQESDVAEKSGTATSFWAAVYSGDLESARLLSEAGCDISLPNSLDFSPFQIACRLGHTDLVDFLFHLCVSSGIHPNSSTDSNCDDEDERYPLLLAVSSGNLTTVQYMIDHLECHLEMKTRSGLSALNLSSSKGYLSIF